MFERNNVNDVITVIIVHGYIQLSTGMLQIYFKDCFLSRTNVYCFCITFSFAETAFCKRMMLRFGTNISCDKNCGYYDNTPYSENRIHIQYFSNIVYFNVSP